MQKVGQEIREKKLFWIVGVLYIVVGLLAFSNAINYTSPSETLWFCYIGMLLIGVGILSRNSSLVASQLYILLIPDFVWTLDFLVHLVSGQPWLGITDYFFMLDRPFLMNLVTLQHLFTIPLILYFFSHMGNKKLHKKHIWLASFVQVSLLFVLTRLFTAPETNVNCAYKFCGNFSVGEPYALWWFASFFAMILVSRWIVMALQK